MENKSQIEKTLIEFFRKNTLVDISKIHSDTLIFKEGLFDSMAFVLLIDFLEENFNIQTPDIDLIEENFESISAIAGYILKQQAASITKI